MSVTEVSTLHRCESSDSLNLCLYDLDVKLKLPGQYDIGGTYINDQPDLWFFYCTSLSPGSQYLLNLFVLHRKSGILCVGVSDGNELSYKNNVGGVSSIQLSEAMSWKILRAEQPDEVSFIKTYCFSNADVDHMRSLKSSMFTIPIRICEEPKCLVTNDVINTVKLEHNFGELLFNKDNTDFVIKTPSGREHGVHKIVLAAHSPVLRSTLKNLQGNTVLIDISDSNLDLLLEFLYTGTIKKLYKQNCLQLLEIADKFQFKSLFLLAQHAISKQVTINNAVDIALLSEKYKLEEMQKKIFVYIKRNPQVLETEGWKKLNDVNLTKKLLEYIYRESRQ